MSAPADSRGAAPCALIRQALRIVMERYQLDEERGRGYLQRVAHSSRLDLLELAAEIVRRAETVGSSGEKLGTIHD